jgi:DNA mismatch endonuclease, patch repair protein
MPDHMTAAQRSYAMKRVKVKGGPLEVLVQRELRRIGLRFQKNCRKLSGSPDIVFPRQKVAIFIDGDFWHGWRLPAWEHKLSEFWKVKLHANRRRDQRNFRRLRTADWAVIRLWEHEIRSDTGRCVARILRALEISWAGSETFGRRSQHR